MFHLLNNNYFHILKSHSVLIMWSIIDISITYEESYMYLRKNVLKIIFYATREILTNFDNKLCITVLLYWSTALIITVFLTLH